jgi:hypothetical protein
MSIAQCIGSCLLPLAPENEALAARIAGQALSKADLNRMVAERWATSWESAASSFSDKVLQEGMLFINLCKVFIDCR